MAANEVEITVTSTDRTNFRSINDNARREAGSINSTFATIGKGAGIAMVAAIGLQVADWARGGLSWMWEGTNIAADIAEAQSKSDTIFGQQGRNQIRQWAQDASQSLGMSELAALDAAGTFGFLGREIGLSNAEMVPFSTDLVQLAADLASFHNEDPAKVIEDLGSAMRGEYDPIQRYIPLINAASVEQKALEMTGKGTTKELTEQEKILARQALLMEGAGVATGDFARTQDSAANKARILAAEQENLQAQIGEKLLPLQTAWTEAKLKLVSVLSDKVIPWLSETGATLREKLQPAWEWWQENKGPIIDAFKELGRAITEELLPAIKELIDEVDWEALMEAAGPVLEALAKTTVGTAIIFIKYLTTMVKTAKGFAEDVASAIGMLRGVIDRASDMWDPIASGIASVAAEVVEQVNIIIAAYNAIPVLPDVGYLSPSGTKGRGVGSGAPKGSGVSGTREARRNALGSTIKRRALGGLAGGLTMVAEDAAELLQFPGGGQMVALPSGTRVQSGPATRGMLGGGGLNVYQVTVNVQGSVLSERELRGVVADAIRGGGLDRLTRSTVR